MMLNRRHFVSTLAASATGTLLLGAMPGEGRGASGDGKLHLATNSYPWLTFFARDGRDFNASLDAGLEEVSRSGVDGFEPILTTPEDVARIAPLLKKHHLEMRSFYVNSVLHEADQRDRSIAEIVAVARLARDVGARIVVTNPSPIQWGGPENKNDRQLRTQADSLNRLGEKLKDISLVLAYHNHDMELRCAAREFHHMMLATDPALVTLCLDSHWIYRGSGNSSVALFDVLELYAKRISELHIRQSVNQIWTEALCDGDIDYRKLVAQIKAIGISPHLVLEQAVEEGTPHTMDAVAAHRASCAYARQVFAPLVQ